MACPAFRLFFTCMPRAAWRALSGLSGYALAETVAYRPCFYDRALELLALKAQFDAFTEGAVGHPAERVIFRNASGAPTRARIRDRPRALFARDSACAYLHKSLAPRGIGSAQQYNCSWHVPANSGSPNAQLTTLSGQQLLALDEPPREQIGSQAQECYDCGVCQHYCHCHLG